MQDFQFDIVIAGGGAAGRILLYFLSNEPGFDEWKILVIESENKIAEKTWCFWNQGQHPFQHLVKKEWKDVSFQAKDFSKSEHIAPYAYCCLQGNEVNNYFEQHFFPRFSNIRFVAEDVLHTQKEKEYWHVHTSHHIYTCTHLVTNLPVSKSVDRLKQHFHGWFIEYEREVFDTNQAVLMDFSAAANKGFTFFYVLPFSSKKALVECTYYSADTLNVNEYEAQLNAYILQHYGGDYRLLQTETGSIPLIEEKPLATEHNHHRIGQSAGMIKASTGYAFQRMTEDARLLASTIGKQNQRRKRHQRFRFYDRLLLCIIREDPQQAVRIFEQLFKHQPIHKILTFLDEDSTLIDEIKIFLRLPWWPFVKRIWKVL